MANLNIDEILSDIQWIKDYVEPEIELTVETDTATSPTGIEYPIVIVKISGTSDENLGHMIGVKGQHLFALQHIIALMLNKKYNADRQTENIRVNLDINSYRADKSTAVERIALSRADDARILGDEIELEPMSSYDRMVVHSTLAKFDDITTESRGEGAGRHVVIIPKGDFDPISEDEDLELEENEE